jgi:hypothetical protein
MSKRKAEDSSMCVALAATLREITQMKLMTLNFTPEIQEKIYEKVYVRVWRVRPSTAV